MESISRITHYASRFTHIICLVILLALLISGLTLLVIVPAPVQAQGGSADLSLVKTASPNPATTGERLTYTLTITNNGPDEATGVVLTDTLPAEVTLSSATSSQGNCSGTDMVTCNLGNLSNGTTATVTIVVTPTQSGEITNTTTVTSDLPETDPTNNTATFTSTVFVSGSALAFDGSDDYVAINTDTFDGLTDVTVSAWVKFEVIDHPVYDAQTIVSALESGTAHYFTLMELDDGNLTLELTAGGTCSLATTSNPISETSIWYHIAAVKAGQDLELYVNGQLIASNSGCTGAIATNTGDTRIGGQHPGGRYLDGTIDEVRLWNTARSQAEIQSTMHTELAGNEPGLAGYWKFNEGSGQVATDSTINSDNDGQLGSTAAVDSSDPTWTTEPVLVQPVDLTWVPFSIDNTANTSVLTDYQVFLTVDTATPIAQGAMRADCGDLRFYDGDQTTPLSYWLEEGCNTAATRLWVKVPIIPAAGVGKIFMVYGHPSLTSASDGEAVFELFDNFTGPSLDLSKWTVSHPSRISFPDGYFRVNTPAGSSTQIETSSTLTNTIGLLIESRQSITAHPYSSYYRHELQYGTSSSLSGVGFVTRPGYASTLFTTSEGSYTIANPPNDDWYISRFHVPAPGGGYLAHQYNESSWQTSTCCQGVGAGILKFWFWATSAYFGQNAIVDVDWIRARKYASTEPIVSQENDLVLYMNGPAEAVVGETINYNLTVQNYEAATAPNVVITHTLPAGVIFTNASTSPTRQTEQNLVWEVGELASFDNINLVITATTSPTATPGPALATAIVTSDLAETDLTNNTATFTSTVFVLGSVLEFDGVDDYVEVPDSATLQGITDSVSIDAWIKLDTLNKWQYILIKDSETSNSTFHPYQLAIMPDNKILFSLGNGTNSWSLESNATLTANTWYHIAAVYDGNDQFLYINGTPDASRNIGSITLHTHDKPLRIGRIREGGIFYYPFDGLIDEIRLWNTARTQTEIQSTMYTELVGNEPDLAGYWKFNESSGQVAQDSTLGGNNDGQLGSTATADSNDPTWTTDLVLVQPVDLTWLPFSIDNTANTAVLTDYQVSITVDTATPIAQGDMRADCSDLRFYDGDQTTPLSYWLEAGCNTAATRLWVKMPTIPAAGVGKIFMTYGHSSLTSASDGEAVFELFDNFTGPSLDLSKWTVSHPNRISFPDGYFRVNTPAGSSTQIETLSSLTNTIGLLIESRQSITAHPYSSYYYHRLEYGTSSNRSGVYFATRPGYPSSLSTTSQGSHTITNPPDDDWYLSRFHVPLPGEGYLAHQYDDSSWQTSTCCQGVGGGTIRFWFGATSAYFGESAIVDVDWIRVRKYASTEPIVSPESDLVLFLTGSAENVVGEAINYDLTVQNYNAATAANVVVTHTLPLSVTFDNASPMPSRITGQNLVWEPGDLAGFDSLDLVITATVSPAAPVGLSSLVTATVTSDLAETDLTNNTATLTATVSALGRVLAFDGSDDYVAVTSAYGLSPVDSVTVEAWLKTNGPVVSTQYIYDRLQTSDGFGLFLNSSGQPECSINGGAALATAGQEIDDSQWHHVACSYDRNAGGTDELKVFVDGQLAGTADYSTPIDYSPTPRNQMGRTNSGSYFNGFMDEVRIWNVGRTATEIQSTMHTGLAGHEPGLVGYWHFDEGHGPVAGDGSPNSNYGQLGSTAGIDNNDPTWATDFVFVKNHPHADFGVAAGSPVRGTGSLTVTFDNLSSPALTVG